MASCVRCPNPKCSRRTYRVEMRRHLGLLSGVYHYDGSCIACGEKGWCHADQDAQLRVGMWHFGTECEAPKGAQP